MRNPIPFADISRTITSLSKAALLLPLAPILLVQARRTARRTPRLDPAAGTPEGTLVGLAPALRLVVIGESTAAGVGAPTHAEALPGHLSHALRDRLQRGVAWSVTGRSGATARKVRTALIPALNGARPDLLVVTVGINDLIRRRPMGQWQTDLTELIGTLRGRYPEAAVLVAGMPPVHRFPAIPQPLRLVLGARAKNMDRIMREVAEAHGATHVPMDEGMARDRALFASDGFHPSPAGYRAWADALAADALAADALAAEALAADGHAARNLVNGNGAATSDPVDPLAEGPLARAT